MRITANTKENLLSAAKAKDEILGKEILFDALSNLIEEDQEQVLTALKKSGVTLSPNAGKERIIEAVSYNIVNNPIFQKNIAVVLAFHNTGEKPSEEDYLSAEGEGGGGGGASWVTAITSAVGSVMGFASSTQELKATEADAKARMYEKILGGQQQEKKTNWLPIIAVAGVLLIGGLVVWRTTGKK
jgi:hypothetical protein